MSDILSLISLAGSVSAVEQSMEATHLKVLYHSNGNSPSCSEYHLKFSELMSKYSGFADEYRSQLNEFHKLLLQTIELKQAEKEKEKERLERLEMRSISNLEIVDNESIGYLTATSVTNNSYNQQSDPEPEPEPEPETEIQSKSISAPVTAPKSVSVSTQTKPKQRPKSKKSINKKKVNNKKQTKKNHNNKPRKIAPIVVSPKSEEKETEQNNMDKPYKYNAGNWRFHGVQKSSTIIFIGNLPWNLGPLSTKTEDIYNSKIAAIQYFVNKRAKVPMYKIEETQLKHGWRGMYALVRFRSDVSLERINKFINTINNENTEIFNKKKEITKGGKTKKIEQQQSWKKRVFLKFNNNSRFYENEDAMYNDPSARHTLFVRNFDILNKKCHYELTQKLTKFDDNNITLDLNDNISVRVDSFGDPYCIVTFKYINDAIFCCNSEIDFNGRTLEMRYSKF